MIRKFIFFFYASFILLMQAGIFLASFFSSKIKQMESGRRETKKWLSGREIVDRAGQVVWMHCSSLGEFEQGRSILESIKKEMPHLKIYLSFFSPSGYEIRKNWPVADHVFYLPEDTRKNAENLIRKINPTVFILVKYDFWWQLLDAMRKHNIPVYLAAAFFQPDRYYLKPPFVHIMKSWKGIFTMRADSEKLLKDLGFLHVTTVGDPRVDRVLAIREQGVQLAPKLETWIRQKEFVCVFGSVWTEDMALVSSFISSFPEMRHLVVPHDTGQDMVQTIQSSIPISSGRITRNEWDKNVLIVDEVGYLSGLYRYACIAYIGGGFGKGVHNILEAAVHGIPVFFGPAHQKFPEAAELIRLGVAHEVMSGPSFLQISESLIQDEDKLNQIQIKANLFFERHRGASRQITETIIKDNFS